MYNAHNRCMKRKFIWFVGVGAILFSLLLLPACNIDDGGSLKTLTKPYIAHYECVKAMYGEKDILQDYEYIDIVLLDKEKFELVYKHKNGERKVIENTYIYDDKKQEFKSNFGIFGVDFKEPIIIKDGKFTVQKLIGKKLLMLNFKTK